MTRHLALQAAEVAAAVTTLALAAALALSSAVVSMLEQLERLEEPPDPAPLSCGNGQLTFEDAP